MTFIVILLIMIALIIYFYRCPTPIIRENNEDDIYSPAFGKILKIEQTENRIFIAIFLSPFDIHYQFLPVSSIVKDVKYDYTGKFKLAYELNKSNENEKVITTLTNKHGDIIIYQIAGLLVRRITSFCNQNKYMNSGEKMGLIHFGSRVDIIIPKTSNFKLYVDEGDYVEGFNTLIGRYME